MKIVDRNMAFGTGSGSASLTLPPRNGISTARHLWYTSAAAGTIKLYRAKQKTTAHAAVSASTALTIHTDEAGKVNGAVLTTSDYVLVCSSNSTVWQLQSISAVAAVSSSTVALTLGGNVTCAALDAIYIVRAADIVTLTTGTETAKAEYVFNSYRQMPVHVLLTAAGTDYISVSVDVEE